MKLIKCLFLVSVTISSISIFSAPFEAHSHNEKHYSDDEVMAAQVANGAPESRFLGFNIEEINGEPHLSATVAAPKALQYLYFDIEASPVGLLAYNETFPRTHSQTTLKATIPLFEALEKVQRSDFIEISLISMDSTPGYRLNSLRYNRQALLELLESGADTQDYSLVVQQPIDKKGNEYGILDGVIKYCMNHDSVRCDYSYLNHPNFDKDGPLQFALPFKGEFTLNAYINELKFREDLTSINKVLPTDFEVWLDNDLFGLGKDRSNAKAFLSNFFTLTHNKNAFTNQYQTKVQWNIPWQHATFQQGASYKRATHAIWSMNFAVQTNRYGSFQDAARQGVSRSEYLNANIIENINFSAFQGTANSLLKLSPMSVEY
ncbi:hypothetical protein [Pseudoalteromonas luteoviolacea]|uniref:hypothetical protein n=1 Tax=Pseudoalteromonas luteoviolacea TaxID=43657 RepID=UPI001B36209E|nr:hypothetical protein [Pseudoalteromonas luteoviolacea]MBQ4835248.1 hypothetical protein [Pseudoalteromonas luteoviolacea]